MNASDRDKKDAKAHETRARDHKLTANKLKKSTELHDQGWAKVCYFYSSLRYVSAALVLDPIFNDSEQLQGIHPDLILKDKRANTHYSKTWVDPKDKNNVRIIHGTNDLVTLLYPSICLQYNELFQTSYDIRYKNGTNPSNLGINEAQEHLIAIEKMYKQGKLVYSQSS